jgi:hypothetical protein
MKTLTLFVLTTLILFSLNSCELAVGGEGVILNENNIPISNAKIYLLLDEKYVDTVYTTEEGKFNIGFMTGMSLSPKIRKQKMIINKRGFEQLILDLNKEEEDTTFKSWKMKLFLKSIDTIHQKDKSHFC